MRPYPAKPALLILAALALLATSPVGAGEPLTGTPARS